MSWGIGHESSVLSVTIASGATTSAAINLRGMRIAALQFATMTGATVSFTAAPSEAGTYVGVVDEAAAAVTVNATDDKVVALDNAASELSGLQWVKIVSASSEAAARTIYVYLKN